MSMIEFAKSELDRIGMADDDPTGEDMNFCMRDHILRMVEEFSKEGHSGYSASYALSIIKKLLAMEPLTPLTGEDDEWMDVYEENDGTTVYQNKRKSSVFKTHRGAYDIDGKVFWEWFTDENGETSKIYFSASGSETPVEFPYTPPDEPIYEYREPEPEDEHEVAYDPNNQPTAEVKAVK